MQIEKVEIKNFRSIRKEEIGFDLLTTFIGRNGVGKSTVLHAIEFFYTINAKIDIEDFHAKDTSQPISVAITYSGLSNAEAKEFASYIADSRLTVKKMASIENGEVSQKYYGTSLQIPQFADVLSHSKKSEQTTAWKELVDSGQLEGLTEKPRAADAIPPIIEAYEATHPELRRPVEREQQFFGPSNVGGGKLDKYTKFVLVPAVREAADELTDRKGAVTKLLEMIVSRKVNSRSDIIKFKKEFNEKLETLFSSENLSELPELAEDITKTLELYAPGTVLHLEWEDPSLPEIKIPGTLASVEEDGFQSDISRKGHGLQRSLILSLLHHLALSTPVSESVEEEDGGEEDPEIVDDRMDLILAIEEPELYQHPLRSRFLVSVLRELAKPQENDSVSANQIIYTSHSPYFVDLRQFDNLRVVRKIEQDIAEGRPAETKVHYFSTSQAAARLQEICPDVRESFTPESFLAHTMPVMNTIVNEGFFADVVLLVEGNTEAALFSALQDVHSRSWSQLGIAVVPAFGKNNIDRPTIVFRGLGIPTYIVFDGDKSCEGKDSEANTRAKNMRYMRLVGVEPEGFPRTRIEESWAVLEDKTETTLKADLGTDIYTSLRARVAEQLGYDKPSAVLKNSEGTYLFVTWLYAEGHRLSTFEQIIQRVERMQPMGN